MATPRLTKHPRLVRCCYHCSAIFYLLLAFLIPFYLFPWFKFPMPSGSYSISTLARYDLTDVNQIDPYTGNSRRIQVNVWYPSTQAATRDPDLWLTSAEAAQISEFMGMPAFVFSYLSHIPTHSSIGPSTASDVAGQNFPVLVFSHGFGGMDVQNTALVEELVSHGYIVLSINHCYESMLCEFSDGTTALFSHPVLTAPPPTSAELHEFEEFILVMNSDSSLQEKRDAFSIFRSSGNAMLVGEPASFPTSNSSELWQNDILFVLDELVNFLPAALLSAADMDTLGLFGHSFGGATSSAVTVVDPRIKATLNMDGFQSSHVLDSNMTVPYMMMYHPATVPMNAVVFLQAQNAAYNVIIEGSLHYDFTDFNLISPAFKDLPLGIFGPLNAPQIHEIVRQYSLCFFDIHLKNTKNCDFDALLHSFEEVILEQNGF